MIRSSSVNISNKDSAISFLRLVVSGQVREAYSTYVANNFRHHNMSFAGDMESLEKAMDESNAMFPHRTIDMKRALEDGDMVAVHSHVRLKPDEPGFATVHLFRFDGDHIVEMWDVVQPVPDKSPNKNGMF